MALRASTVRCLVGAIWLLSITARAGDTQIKKTPFRTGAIVVSALSSTRNPVVCFRAVFISGDFFKDIRQHKKAIEFRHGETVF